MDSWGCGMLPPPWATVAQHIGRLCRRRQKRGRHIGKLGRGVTISHPEPDHVQKKIKNFHGYPPQGCILGVFVNFLAFPTKNGCHHHKKFIFTTNFEKFIKSILPKMPIFLMSSMNWTRLREIFPRITQNHEYTPQNLMQTMQKWWFWVELAKIPVNYPWSLEKIQKILKYLAIKQNLKYFSKKKCG